ncbi:O-antigen ligase family protein [Rothia sp. 88186D007BW]
MAHVGVTEQGKLTMGEKTMGELAQEAAEKARVQASQIRMPEFLMFAAMVYSDVIPGVGLPFDQGMVFVALAYAITRQPAFELGKWSRLFIVLAFLLTYVAVVSALADPSEYAADWTRRLIRLIATTGLIYVISVGQIHLRSAILGFSTGLLINALLFYAGIAPDTYGGYLTGYLGDKNYAGFVHAIFALLIMTVFKKRWQKITVFIISCGLLWTTGSRTSLAALAFACLWIIISPKLVPILKIGLLGIFWWLLNFITEDFSQASVFGDRTGTDALRARIDEMAWAKVQQTGFFGQGLGEAYVYDFEGERTWFFHNSYWSAFVEGGWIWATCIVAITLFVAVRPISPINKEWTPYELIAQGIGIALMICALRLGEVFYTLPWAICMGFVIRASIVSKPEIENKQIFGYDQYIPSNKF